MLSFEIFITFYTASILLALVPGPDNIFVLTQSALHGKFSGLVVVLGLCSGLIVHTTVVALGIAIVFQTSIIAFTVLKSIGAIYLVYLAILAFKATTTQISDPCSTPTNYRKLYLRGLIMNITNPKVSIFFLAFLPQFINPTLGTASIQILQLGGVFIFATILIFGVIALMGSKLGQLLHKSSKIQNILNKVAGVIFIGLALKLAISEN